MSRSELNVIEKPTEKVEALEMDMLPEQVGEVRERFALHALAGNDIMEFDEVQRILKDDGEEAVAHWLKTEGFAAVARWYASHQPKVEKVIERIKHAFSNLQAAA